MGFQALLDQFFLEANNFAGPHRVCLVCPNPSLSGTRLPSGWKSHPHASFNALVLARCVGAVCANTHVWHRVPAHSTFPTGNKQN